MPSAGAAPAASETLRGIVSILLAIALFGVMDAMIKALASAYPTAQLVFFRSCFALLPLGVAVARSGGLGMLKTRRPLAHVARSCAGLGSMACFFASYASLPLAEVYAIAFAAPLMLTALAGPMLGEQVGWRRWCAVLVGFAGVLVILRPGSDVLSAAALLCLAGTVLYALAMVTIRKLSATETTVSIVFYFTLTCTLAGAAAMLPAWVTPRSAADLAMLVGTGIVGGLAQLLMTNAFRRAPAATLAPFEYTGLLWGISFGWLFFGEWPDSIVFVGAGIVAAAGLYIVHREAVRHRALRAGAATAEHPF